MAKGVVDLTTPLSLFRIKLCIFISIAQDLKAALQICASDDHGAPAVIRMERECLGLLQVGIKEEDDVMFLIVDQTEGRDTTWFQAEVTHHAVRRGETEFARRVETCCHESLLEAMFHVVDVHIMVAMEADEVVLVAFMIAEEKILAVDAAILSPPALGLLDGLAFGMAVAGVRDVMRVKPRQDLLCTLADYFVVHARANSFLTAST